MRLVSAVLGFVLRKAGLLLAVMLSLFLGYLVIQAVVPAVREAVAERDRLEDVTKERAALEADLDRLEKQAAEGRSRAVASLQDRLDTEIEEGRRSVAEQKAEVRRLRASAEDACGFLSGVVDFVVPGSPCETAQDAARKANDTLDTIEGGLSRAEADAAVLADPDLTTQQKLDRLGEGGDPTLEREIDATDAELDQTKAEQRSLEQAQGSGVRWVVDQWSRSWRWLATIAVLALVMPVVLRVVSYFVLMPLVHRAHRPIRLVTASEHEAATLRTSQAQRTLTVRLDADEVLSARSEHVRPVQARIRSRLLYDWTSPFISFAAGLYGLSRITGDAHGSAATLATPEDPNSYLMRIDFEDHPGVVMHPRHVVGVLGTPELQTRWRWSIASFATWQVRYILFSGTGGLIVQGSGDVVATNPEGRSSRMEQNLLMGFDSRLSVGVNRTEVFWPYLWRRTPLVDDEFTGSHPFFWQKSTAEGPSNPIAKTFDAIFSALGKLLGF